MADIRFSDNRGHVLQPGGVNPAGEVVPDVNRKLPGRGLWITGKSAALAEAGWFTGQEVRL